MRSYNAIIVEDEKFIRDALHELIVQNCPHIQICGLAGTAVEARAALKANDVDFIFLDISMPEEDGFALLNSINKESYGVIFTTAYHEYAIKALRANAIDYLMKPINPLELRDAVTRAINNLNIRSGNAEERWVYRHSLEGVEDQYFTYGSNMSKITVAEQFGFKIIELSELMYLEADDNYTSLHLDGGRKVVATKNLGEFEKIIECTMFMRIHKSYIVNIKFIVGYSTLEGNYAELKDGTRLQISRRKLVEFRQWLKRYSTSID